MARRFGSIPTNESWPSVPGGPNDAEYLTGAANGDLTAERVVTNTSTVAWDLGTPGQAKANVPDDSITYAKIQNITDARVLGRAAGSAGDTQELTAGAGISIAGGAIASTITQYTDEQAQDAVGGILTDTATIDFTYNDGAPSITADVKDDSITFDKTQNIATNRILGRSTAGSGNIEELTPSSPIQVTGGTVDFDETVALGNNARVAVSKNSGATVGTRRELNFIEGSNITLTIADDAGNEEVDITIAATGGGGAPTGAEYLVGALDGTLTNERLVTDTATVAWDLATGGQAKANVPDNAITNAKLRDSSALSVIGRSANSAGDPADIAASAASDAVLRESGSTIGFGTVATGGIANDAVTFAKMQNIATDRLIGRDTAATGDPEELTVGGGIEFTGAGGIQTSAFTGDVTKVAGGTAQTIANDAVTYAKIQNVTDARVLGRAAGSAGDVQELSAGTGISISGGAIASTITQYTDEQAQDAVGTILVDTATIDFTYDDATPAISAIVIDNSISNAKLRDSVALSVIGRSANSAGDPADIAATATSGAVLRESGSTVGFGQVATAGIADDAVTYAKIQNVTDARLLGRSAGSAGDVQEITVGSPVTLSSGTLDFDETVTLGNNARVAVSKNSGAVVGTRRRINLIEGANVTLTISDDAGNEEVDITIAASGGGGGGGSWTEAEVDFGSGKPQYDALFTITDGTVTAASKIIIVPSGKVATGRVLGDDQWDAITYSANPASGSFTVYAVANPGPVVGRRKVQYTVA